MKKELSVAHPSSSFDHKNPQLIALMGVFSLELKPWPRCRNSYVQWDEMDQNHIPFVSHLHYYINKDFLFLTLLVVYKKKFYCLDIVKQERDVMFHFQEIF